MRGGRVMKLVISIVQDDDALDLIDEVLDDYSSIQDMWENL